MSEEKIAMPKAEVQWLLDAGFIREVEYPTWLANVVMVKKKEWKIMNVHRFHRLEQMLPQRQFLAIKNRQNL
jgi:ADP-heptose:LPS heptosyltransferase